MTLPLTWGPGAVLREAQRVIRDELAPVVAEYVAEMEAQYGDTISLPELADVQRCEWTPEMFAVPGVHLSVLETRISPDGVEGLDSLSVEYDVRATLVCHDGSAASSDPQALQDTIQGLAHCISHLVQATFTGSLRGEDVSERCGVYDCRPARTSWYDPIRSAVDGSDIWLQRCDIRWAMRGRMRQRYASPSIP